MTTVRMENVILTGTIAIDESETEAGTTGSEITDDEKRHIDTEDDDFSSQEAMG